MFSVIITFVKFQLKLFSGKFMLHNEISITTCYNQRIVTGIEKL